MVTEKNALKYVYIDLLDSDVNIVLLKLRNLLAFFLKKWYNKYSL